ncbi:reverse transcriptase domain-containing protein [Tanacetum coccineum]
MTGVPWHIAEHRLNIREGCLPIRQKKRGQAPERNKAIQEEVEKLVDARIMKEVHYHSWLSNPAMDGYPLPEIDWKIESLCGYPFKCFLDAYKGYHQIKMAKDDEEKTAFITSQGIFCYSKMPFGLKNVRATYQRLVDRAFQKQIGRNLEVYVDDLVIKSCTEEEIIRDIEETFKTPRQINMKLNPKKCTFRMQEGMFLGYKVNVDGLKVCPDKADAVLSLPSLRCLKDVQKLNGKLASLNSYQRSLNDRKGRQAIAIVLCKPCPARAGDQLHPHGKIGISLAQRKQTAEKGFIDVEELKANLKHVELDMTIVQELLILRNGAKLSRRYIMVLETPSGYSETFCPIESFQFTWLSTKGLVAIEEPDSRLQHVAERARELGSPDVLFVFADVSKVDECRKFVDDTIEHFGRLDHIVCNAGIGPVYSINIDVTKYTSVMASKAALISFYESLRFEVSPKITITILTLGFIQTNIITAKYSTAGVGVQIKKDMGSLYPTMGAEPCAKAIVDGILTDMQSSYERNVRNPLALNGFKTSLDRNWMPHPTDDETVMVSLRSTSGVNDNRSGMNMDYYDLPSSSQNPDRASQLSKPMKHPNE